MPTLWRISDFADLSGRGGLLSSARWHTSPREIVYLAEHPALALLENIVHLNVELSELPASYQLLEVSVSDVTEDEEISAAELDALSAGWRGELAFTRELGDRWLDDGRTSLYRVPSAILPQSTNVLLNPAHPDATSVKIVSITRPAYDPRLFRAGPG